MLFNSVAHKEATTMMTSQNDDITLTLSTKHWLSQKNMWPPNWGDIADHQVCECSAGAIMPPVPRQQTCKSPGTQLIISKDAGLWDSDSDTDEGHKIDWHSVLAYLLPNDQYS